MVLTVKHNSYNTIIYNRSSFYRNLRQSVYKMRRQYWYATRSISYGKLYLPYAPCLWTRNRLNSRCFLHFYKACYISNVPLRSMLRNRQKIANVIVRKDMTTIKKRLSTFDGRWNDRNSVSREELATIGFFMSAYNVTQCFSCGLLFYDWNMSDVPMREHIRLAPMCYFATKLYERLKKYTMRSVNRRSLVRVLIPDKRKKNSIDTSFERAYEDVKIRESSYIGRWKLQTYLPARMMADIGFVYIGYAGLTARKKNMIARGKSHRSDFDVACFENSDVVQCFNCQYIFYEWSSEACPFTEHSSWSENCKYLRLYRERNKIEMARTNNEERSFITDFYSTLG